MKIKINSLALMMILSSKSEVLHKNPMMEPQTLYFINKGQQNPTNQLNLEQLKNIIHNSQTTQVAKKQSSLKKNDTKFSIKNYKKETSQKAKNRKARSKVRLKHKKERNKDTQKLMINNQLELAKHNRILLKNDIKNIQKKYIAKINAIKTLNKTTNKIQNNQYKKQNKIAMMEQINTLNKNAAQNITTL